MTNKDIQCRDSAGRTWPHHSFRRGFRKCARCGALRIVWR